jgi:hypothetical protein
MSLEFYCRIHRIFFFNIGVLLSVEFYGRQLAITADCPPIRQVARVSTLEELRKKICHLFPKR